MLDDDLFVVIGARPASVSFSSDMAEMPGFMQKNFSRNNILVIYPEQFGDEMPMESFVDPMESDISSAPISWLVRVRAAAGRLSAALHLTRRRRSPKNENDLKL